MGRSRKEQRDKDARLRPEKGTKTREDDKRLKHGFYSISALFTAEPDKRLAIVKAKDRLEAQLIDHCGEVTPPILSLIKRITHKELIASHCEKMALMGEFDLRNKEYLALVNSQRLDISTLEKLVSSTTGGKFRYDDAVKSITVDNDE